MKATVLLTGINGFIGLETALHLLKSNYKVIGSLRDIKTKQSIIDSLQQHSVDISNLEFVQAKFSEIDIWQAITEKCDYVVHIASPNPAYFCSEYIDDAILGTKNIITAAINSNIKKIILLSSVSACVFGHNNLSDYIYTESDWTNLESNKVSNYSKSKTISEIVAKDLVKNSKSNTSIISILPGLVLGRLLKNNFSASTGLIAYTLQGKFPGLPKIGYPLVDVQDVAHAVLLALETKQNFTSKYERFICADKFLWLKDMAEILRANFPSYRNKIPKYTIPSWIMKISQLFDREIESIVYDLDFEKKISSDKIKSVLGWEPKFTVEESIIATANDLINKKII